MSDIILHHYPPSPVSEKVRVALGMKGLAWRSVEIPRVPPKPLLMPLTGGYRRTPVMQVGADIYCDSHVILLELQRRHPLPALEPQGVDGGLGWMMNRWADLAFETTVRLSLGANAAQLPEAFARDRVRLFLGPDGSLDALDGTIGHHAAQLRAQFAWIDGHLRAGTPFLQGPSPGVADAACYHLIWFLRGRWSGGPTLLAGFQALEAWEARVRDIGHGSPSPMTPEEALAVARGAEPLTPESADPADPQGLVPGQMVRVVPDTDSGETAVQGVIRLLDHERIALWRDDPEAGWVCVHFPRAGYRVEI
jgi:glutathione S-transferase